MFQTIITILIKLEALPQPEPMTKEPKGLLYTDEMV